jgi:bacillithiol biosynthesis cysteine-adding enzyme BshC
MKTTKIALEQVPHFSSTFLAYINQDPGLTPFYHHFPSIEAAGDQMKEKSFPSERRALLSNVLEKQYAEVNSPEPVSRNISLLRDDNTYTVVTGHQLNIFTGPLYVILKMITTINACEALKKAYPDKEFVPIYWMATEDHDFEEINHFHFNGKRFQWDSTQTGAVGRFSTQDMSSLLQQLSAFPSFMLRAYHGKKTLATAVREYMTSLFGEYGLVVLDADDRDLKATFKNVMRDDILECTIQPEIAKISQTLNDKGYKTQVYARQVNFFYLEGSQRLRIEKHEDSTFSLVGGDQVFTTEELKQIIEDHPERLSPNVILRPLYQESILPNLAYCGGPSELIYWLQIAPLFPRYSIPFPMLLPRNYAMIVPSHLEMKWNKTGYSLSDMFKGKEYLLKDATLRESGHQVKLNGQKKALEVIFNQIKQQAATIDPTMSQHVEAQWAKTEKRLDIMEKKFIRAEKRHHTDLLRQIEEVLDTLFPGGGLQERHTNIMEFYQTNQAIIQELKDLLDPFDYSFNVIHHG